MSKNGIYENPYGVKGAIKLSGPKQAPKCIMKR